MIRNRKLMILLIVLGVIGIAIGMAYAIDVYRNRYTPDPLGAGICYHKPQDVVGHVVEPKPRNIYYQYYYS